MLEIDARSYISEIRNGLTVGNDNNVLYLPRTVAPDYATLQSLPSLLPWIPPSQVYSTTFEMYYYYWKCALHTLQVNWQENER